MCNNNPKSAPLINGRPFVLCWRCCGAVCGLLFILILNRFYKFTINPLIFLILIMPASVDWFFTRIEFKKGNNRTRFITGSLIGISIGLLELSFMKYL